MTKKGYIVGQKQQILLRTEEMTFRQGDSAETQVFISSNVTNQVFTINTYLYDILEVRKITRSKTRMDILFSVHSKASSSPDKKSGLRDIGLRLYNIYFL